MGKGALWILSINKCDLLSYHQRTLKVSMFIPNTDPKSASRPCRHTVMALNGVKADIQNTVMIYSRIMRRVLKEEMSLLITY